MQIKVASPCKKDWAKMSGDEKVRACAECKLNVYNLSAMTEAEVKRLVEEREGRLCVRFFLRHDGTVLTRDCPVGVTRKRRTYAFSMAAVVSLLAAPFVTRAEPCELSGGGEASVVDQVRGLVDDLKVRLGLSPPHRSPVMGKMMYVPPKGP